MSLNTKACLPLKAAREIFNLEITYLRMITVAIPSRMMLDKWRVFFLQSASFHLAWCNEEELCEGSFCLMSLRMVQGNSWVSSCLPPRLRTVLALDQPRPQPAEPCRAEELHPHSQSSKPHFGHCTLSVPLVTHPEALAPKLCGRSFF